jgi:hypothetical protein
LKIHALHIQNKSLLADPSTAQQVWACIFRTV